MCIFSYLFQCYFQLSSLASEASLPLDLVEGLPIAKTPSFAPPAPLSAIAIIPLSAQYGRSPVTNLQVEYIGLYVNSASDANHLLRRNTLARALHFKVCYEYDLRSHETQMLQTPSTELETG